MKLRHLFSGLAMGVLCSAATAAPSALTWTTTTESLTPLLGFIQMHGSATITTAGRTFVYTIGGNISGATGITPRSAANDIPYVYFAEELSTGTLSPWTTATVQLDPATVSPYEPGYTYTERKAFGYNGRVYVVGGNNNGAPPERQTVTIMEPAANGDVTTVTEQIITGTYAGQGAFGHTAALDVTNGRLWVVMVNGSTPANGVHTAQIDSITGLVGAFTQPGAMTGICQQGQSLVHNGYLYAFGGLGTNTIKYAAVDGAGNFSGAATATATFPANRFDTVALKLGGEVYQIAGTVSGNTTTVNTVFRVVFGAGGDVVGLVADTPLPATPGLRRHTGVATADSIYIPGGRLDGTVLTGDVFTAPVPPPLPTAAQDWNLLY